MMLLDAKGIFVASIFHTRRKIRFSKRMSSLILSKSVFHSVHLLIVSCYQQANIEIAKPIYSTAV